MSVPPPVTWAQRDNLVYLTICVEDCKDAVVNLEPSKVYFKGTGGPEKKAYEYTLELYGEIDTATSRKFLRDRNIELFLMKKERGPYWPHLLKEKTKQHWLKVDFSKWRDEDDDSDVEAGGGGGGVNDLEQMMSKMGNFGGEMGPGGDRPSLDDLGDGDDETDSDDDALPDLE